LIRMIYEENEFRPVVECDVCVQRIDDAAGANVEFSVDRDTFEPQGRIYFVHKGCSTKLRGTEPTAEWFWQPLEPFLLFLGNSISFNETRAKEHPHVRYRG